MRKIDNIILALIVISETVNKKPILQYRYKISSCESRIHQLNEKQKMNAKFILVLMTAQLVLVVAALPPHAGPGACGANGEVCHGGENGSLEAGSCCKDLLCVPLKGVHLTMI